MPAFSLLQLASGCDCFAVRCCFGWPSCAPISLKRAFCSSLSELLNATTAGFTVWIASSVACSRWVIACSRPTGVIGTASGQASLNFAAASLEAWRRFSSRPF